MQQGAWFSCAGVARGAVRDSQMRRRHTTPAVRDLQGQVVRGIEIVTASGKMIPRQLRPIRFDANADQAKPLFHFSQIITAS